MNGRASLRRLKDPLKRVLKNPLNLQYFFILCSYLLFDGCISSFTVEPCPLGYGGSGEWIRVQGL